MNRRKIRRGEALAIMSEALHSGPDGSWWDVYQGIPNNERIDTVAIVSIRGSLEHHDGAGSDSYESILDRVAMAMDGGDDSKPSCVVLRIDSPGGVVSGLNEAVHELRRMSADARVPLIAYVDEMAASAAYALACACREIYLPAAAIAGSIGVISTMADQTEADKAMGVNFVTLTSGARKADGHPHAPISNEAIEAEQGRVDRLARQFYRIVAQARPVSVQHVASLEAGVFLGSEAVESGLADDVMGWAALIDTLADPMHTFIELEANHIKEKFPEEKKKLVLPPNAGPASHAHVGKQSAKEKPMSLIALQALVKRASASLASEKDPKKKKVLSASLSTYKAALEALKKEKLTIEKHEMEEAADEEAPEEEKCEEAAADSSGELPDSDDDDDDKDEDDDEAEEKAAASAHRSLAALAQSVTGRKGSAAVGALAAMIAEGQRAAATVKQISSERRAEKKAAAIEGAIAARRITRHEAKTLVGKDLGFVTSFLEMRPKAIINVDDDSVHIPNPNAKVDAAGNLSPDLLAAIDTAMIAAPDGVDKKALRQSMVDAHQKRMASANGAGRY